MPRRNRILLEQRERIIRAFEDTNEDYLMVADTIGVNRSTARSIVARYIREGRIAERPRGGANNVRVDNEMKDCLNDILNDNCMLHIIMSHISLPCYYNSLFSTLSRTNRRAFRIAIKIKKTSVLNMYMCK